MITGGLGRRSCIFKLPRNVCLKIDIRKTLNNNQKGKYFSYIAHSYTGSSWFIFQDSRSRIPIKISLDTLKAEVIDFAGFVSFIELFVLKNKTSSFESYYSKGTFASGVLMRPILCGIESASIRRKWMYWNLVQTTVSKAAGGLISANSISLPNRRRSVQKSFPHFFLPSTNNFKSGLNSVSLDLSTTFHFHTFLEKNPMQNMEMIVSFSQAVTQSVWSACSKCSQLQSACFHYRWEECPV